MNNFWHQFVLWVIEDTIWFKRPKYKFPKLDGLKEVSFRTIPADPNAIYKNPVEMEKT